MDYRVLPPGKDLQDIISHFWIGTWDAESRVPLTSYYIIATTLTDIVFAFQGATSHSELVFSAIQGQTPSARQMPVAGFHQLMGVSIRAFALPWLFGLPPVDLGSDFLSLETFLGHEGRVLNERIALAYDTDQRLAILAGFLRSRMKQGVLNDVVIKDRMMSSAMNTIRKDPADSRIIDLAGRFDLSPKQFKRRFMAFSGFNPKVYARVARFESVIENYSAVSNLTDLAYASGYYDQAHFNHEFKGFTGFSPGDFWKLGEDTVGA